MKEKLLNLLENAYTPYYKFPVAAIVKMKDGSEFGGVNVENANGTSVCAERNAIHNAIAHGYKKGDFASLYIMAKNTDDIVPCFACRQVILEFFNLDDEIISVKSNGLEKMYKVGDLCPYAFSEESL